MIYEYYNKPPFDKLATINNIYKDIIYISSIFGTKPELLEENDIKNVISIGCYPPIYHKNINYYYYDFEDNESQINDFFQSILMDIHPFINECIEKNEKVLIHCNAGKSRSVSVVILWFMIYQKMNYNQAFNYVLEKRNVIEPNKHFVKFLQSYEFL